MIQIVQTVSLNYYFNQSVGNSQRLLARVILFFRTSLDKIKLIWSSFNSVLVFAQHFGKPLFDILCESLLVFGGNFKTLVQIQVTFYVAENVIGCLVFVLNYSRVVRI